MQQVIDLQKFEFNSLYYRITNLQRIRRYTLKRCNKGKNLTNYHLKSS